MRYYFQSFTHSKDLADSVLNIPELSDGFDIFLQPPVAGMVPVSYVTEEMPFGVYAVHIVLEAAEDMERLFLFTGRKQLRDVVSLRKGERYERTFYQSVAEIIPRYHEKVYPVRNLFFSYCVSEAGVNRGNGNGFGGGMDSVSGGSTFHGAVKMGECYAEQSDGIPVIWLCGDSTVTDQSSEIPYHPGACYASWGQALPAFLRGRAAVENQAHCGLTTETFRKEGHMAIVKKHIRPGDLCLIQFGHNDQKLPHLLADREYPVNLKRYVMEVRDAGAIPVLVTSLGRNIWKPDGSYHELLAEHVLAVKDVAQETGTACIDLHAFSVDMLKQKGMEASCGYFHPGDYTHTNEYGAYLFASFIAGELSRLFPDIAGPAAKPVEFEPPKNLWSKLKQGNNRILGNGEKEQFDCMEKSTTALLEALRKAKEFID